MSTTTAGRRAGPRGRRRLGVLAATAALACTFGVLAPGTAHAEVIPPGSPPVPCDTLPDIAWYAAGPIVYGYNYTLVAAAPTFNVSDSRVVENNLDAPITATFTSQQSRTFTAQVQLGSQMKFNEFLTTTVSGTIVQTQTTQIGVSAAVPVPAFSRVIGEYGVHAYNVEYDAQRFYRGTSNLFPGPACLPGPVYRFGVNAPTYIEGWRFSSG